MIAISGAREVVSACVTRSGLTRLLETVPPRPCLIVLGYHRIGHPEQSPYDRGVFDARPESFHDQVTYLKSRFPVVSLEEAQELIRRPERIRRPHVLLTFDDGYRDAYDTTFRILRSAGVPGAFFLTTSFIDSRRLPWWDQIAFLVRHCRMRRLVLDYPHRVLLDLDQVPMETAIRQILLLYKSPAVPDAPRFLAGLESACEARLPQEAPERQFLSWAEAAEMAGKGMSFGSHTHSHPLLSKLTEAEQREELQHSRDLIRRHLGVPADALAYPVGSRSSFSEVTQRVLVDLGYQTAFSFDGGVNTPGRISPFDILRLSADLDVSFTRFRLQTALAAVAARELL